MTGSTFDGQLRSCEKKKKINPFTEPGFRDIEYANIMPKSRLSNQASLADMIHRPQRYGINIHPGAYRSLHKKDKMKLLSSSYGENFCFWKKSEQVDTYARENGPRGGPDDERIFAWLVCAVSAVDI